jgi:cysteine synthase B
MITSTKSIGTSILQRIGNTPLVRLEGLSSHLPGILILGKAEWNNPGGSVKDRAASAIVTDARRRGLLTSSRRHRLFHAGRGAGLFGDPLHALQRLS